MHPPYFVVINSLILRQKQETLILGSLTPQMVDPFFHARPVNE
jgi:hypothetical protein